MQKSVRVRILDFGVHSPSGRYATRVISSSTLLYGSVINTNIAVEDRPIFVEISRL
jgi:hypothetical protein